MKEIQPQDKDQVSIVAEKEIEKKQILRGSIRRIKGLILYKMSTKTGNISEVNLEKSKIASFSKKQGKQVTKAKLEENYLYEQALNPKNAKRKFEKAVKKIIQG